MDSRAVNEIPRGAWLRRPMPWWAQRLMLLLMSVVLLSLAFAPVGQFYLAWIAMVPWMLVVRECQSRKAAFFWSWLAGSIFYVVNMWWLSMVTLPGTAALLLYIGSYWGWAALALRGCRLLPGSGRQSFVRPALAVLMIPAVWTALEWVRGYILWGGLPWLYLGHSQTPILPMCQIADIAGHWGVSFWVMMVNAMVYIAATHRGPRRQILPSAGVVAGVLLAICVYGMFRMGQETTTAGPRILVVQSNFPQSVTGEKGATIEQIIDFHTKATRDAIVAHGPVDLVVWSETMMPELNDEYIEAFVQSARELPASDTSEEAQRYRKHAGQLVETRKLLQDLARECGANLLVGGLYTGGRRFNERRNSVYLFDRDGRQSTQRYDKVHLVPFGEFIPFKESFPPLYKLLNLFNPYGYDYTLVAGAPEDLTVFRISPAGGGSPWRVVTPICFEDIDSALCAAMFRPDAGTSAKRADILVNVTNDGWFRSPENAMHLQAATFRGIENRVPTARSVNTGVSGFVDSVGRAGPILPARTEGALVAQVKLDRRTTLYSQWGDVFAVLCVAAMASMFAVALAAGWMRRPGPADSSNGGRPSRRSGR